MRRGADVTDLLIGLAPLVILLLAVGAIIWCGMRTRPGDAANMARGGRANSHHAGPD